MLKSTSAKITIGIIILTTILLSFVSTFTVYKTRTEFEKVIRQHQLFIRGFNTPVAVVPKGPDIQREFEENLYKTTLLANLVSIFLAMILGYLIARHITKPLYTLTRGIRKLRDEDYKFEIVSDIENEFGEVINEFNTLIQKLDQSEKLRQELITDISHDLKTPLTSISIQVEGIRDGVFEPTEDRLVSIQDQVKKLNILIDELREYAKVRSKTVSLNISEVNIYDLVERLVQSFKEDLKKVKINFENKIDQELVIEVDKKLLERCINNLLDNAIKYSKAENIIISGNNSQLIFEDNGIGINEEDSALIFERFYRVDKSRNKNSGGLGLGLAIVKDIITAHGWGIEVGKGTNDKGTRFIIKFSS